MAILRERKRKILETYETDTVQKSARDAYREMGANVSPPKKLRKHFQQAFEQEQIRELERVWRAYGIGVEPTTNDITHGMALYLIDRRGFERAKRRVILGDGALWIWNLAGEHFPGAIQIVDRFHAKQHLSDVAKAIWGPESELGRDWAAERHDQLDRGELQAIISALRVHADAEPEARRCIDYISRNRRRIDRVGSDAGGESRNQNRESRSAGSSLPRSVVQT